MKSRNQAKLYNRLPCISMQLNLPRQFSDEIGILDEDRYYCRVLCLIPL